VAISSDIEWTDATWNPLTGCTKISAGKEIEIVAEGGGPKRVFSSMNSTDRLYRLGLR
jgi:hypothetical protein